jgi:hypothetical protein
MSLDPPGTTTEPLTTTIPPILTEVVKEIGSDGLLHMPIDGDDDVTAKKALVGSSPTSTPDPLEASKPDLSGAVAAAQGGTYKDDEVSLSGDPVPDNKTSLGGGDDGDDGEEELDLSHLVDITNQMDPDPATKPKVGSRKGRGGTRGKTGNMSKDDSKDDSKKPSTTKSKNERPGKRGADENDTSQKGSVKRRKTRTAEEKEAEETKRIVGALPAKRASAKSERAKGMAP